MMYGSSTFEGGGFMPSQTTQTADPSPSFAPSTSRDSKPLIPLTVKHMRDALPSSDDKDDLLIDGVNVNQVKVLGIVSEKTERVTDVLFGVDDGTGRIDCTRWLHEDVECGHKGNGRNTEWHVRPSSWSLEKLSGKKATGGLRYQLASLARQLELESVLLFCGYSVTLCSASGALNASFDEYRCEGEHSSMDALMLNRNSQPLSGQNLKDLVDRPVMDYNEKTHHLVECIYVHVYNTRLKRKGSSAGRSYSNREALRHQESEGLVYSTIDKSHYMGNG